MRLKSLLIALIISTSLYSQEYYMFIGTYTSGKSKGIYVYKFNATTGRAVAVSSISSKNPSYLALSKNGSHLYAVNENGSDQSGDLSSFVFNKATGKLEFQNKRSTGGADPCYVSVTKNGKWAFTANYSGGSLSAIPIEKNGSLDSVAEIIQHQGGGPNTQRQEKAHVHSVILSPDERFLLVADLGNDKETIYGINGQSNQPLNAAAATEISIDPGSGPRHLSFHPKKPFAYIIEELSGSIDVFHYDSASGQLNPIQRISTVPADFQGDRGSADIHLSPNGRYLYASNRGDVNSIAIYAVDPASGKLSLQGFQSVLGKHPRNFIIDPTGRFLLVANRDTDNIVVFKINAKTGLLKATGYEIKIPNPVCIKLLKK